MSLLLAMQRAATSAMGVRPNLFFGSSGQLEMEFCDLVNEVAEDVVKAFDWQALVRVHDIVGDGEQKSFPIPNDYDRMMLTGQLTDTSAWFWNYYHAKNMDEFIKLELSHFMAWPGAWIMSGDRFNFTPSPTGEARFPYISKNYAIDGGTQQPKDIFEHDSDQFVLDDHLLTAGLVWRWRDQKAIPDMGARERYETLLQQNAARDGGSRVIRRGRRSFGRTSLAWPTVLGPLAGR